MGSGDWASPSRVNSHEVATRWPAPGSVAYLEPAPLRGPKLRDLDRLAARFRGRLPVSAGGVPAAPSAAVEVIRPLFLPWHPTSAARAWNVAAAHRAIRHRARRTGTPVGFDVLWFFSPALAGLERRIPARLVIYHAVDDYSANPDVRGSLVARREAELVGRADLVFASSEPLARRLRRSHPRVMTWTNVSNTAHLAEIAARHRHPRSVTDRPVAVFVGHLAPHKVDFDLMLHLVRHLADWRFVLAGQYVAGSESGQALLRAPNVEYLGPVARDDLATRFAEADVALLPLPDTPLHQASFPIKVFDYLALGLPIVGRRSEPLQGLGDLVLPAVTVEEYAGAMRSAIVMRDDPGFLARARRVALENSWEPRIEALTRSIRRELAGRSLTIRKTSRAGFMASGAGGRRDPNEPPE